MQSSGSTPQVALPPRIADVAPIPVNPYERLTFQPASQAQILRAHQRDGSHIQTLVELVSELIRSVQGTRWLAIKQPIIDVSVKTIYLGLTLGRAVQTLGEEYTDILPHAKGRSSIPRTRRILSILLLLGPALLSAVRLESDGHSVWSRGRNLFAHFLKTPLGQSLPALHLVAFLYGGKFLEFGRRLSGLRYISAAPPRTDRRPSYEPLAALLVIPLLFRLWKARQPVPSIQAIGSEDFNPLPQTASGAVDDEPNTYLTLEAADSGDRQCTLCLEPRGTGQGSGGTVAVTECGHVFCWGCLGGLDKPECPLCRQSLRLERLLAAYNL